MLVRRLGFGGFWCWRRGIRACGILGRRGPWWMLGGGCVIGWCDSDGRCGGDVGFRGDSMTFGRRGVY